MAWENYYKVHKNSNTSKLLLEAEKYITLSGGKCLDIGSGTGRDIDFFLSKDFEVVAIDLEEQSINIINESFKDNNKVVAVKTTIEDFEVNKNEFNFINAQFVLFFINQNKIEKVLEKIKLSLNKGGIFCGQVLGKEDDWASWNPTNWLSKEDIEKIFSGFEIYMLEEVKKRGMTAAGTEKLWNYYNLIIKK